MRPYEIISHTADIGIKAYGSDARELFMNAAGGMFDILIERKTAKRSAKKINIEKKAENIEELLVLWLGELLFLFSARYIVPDNYSIELFNDKSLRAEIGYHKLSVRTDTVLTEIKAVTYHGLSVKKTGTGFEAQVIFDV